MKQKLNIPRYLELVAEEKKYDKQNKVFFEEDKEAFLELLNYRANVECEISFAKKDIYFSLVENYLMEKITPDKFRADFLDLQDQDSKDGTNILNNLEKLSTFSISSKTIEFSSLLIDVYNCSMIVMEEEGLSETEFRDSIERIFQKLSEFTD